MFKKLIVLVAVATGIESCKTETKFTKVQIDDRYEMEIPSYLKPCTDLHENASLQYQNTERDIYAMVIDEKKKTMQQYDLDYDLNLYFNSIASQPFLETIKNGEISPPGRQEINGNKALVADITGEIGGQKVYYRMCVIESPYQFYQILIWSRAENREELLADMTIMIESFKELPHPAEDLPEPKLSDSVVISPAW